MEVEFSFLFPTQLNMYIPKLSWIWWIPLKFLLASSKGSMTCNIPGKKPASKRNTARICRVNTIFCLWIPWPVQNPWTQTPGWKADHEWHWESRGSELCRAIPSSGWIGNCRNAQRSCRIPLGGQKGVQCPWFFPLEFLCSSALDPNCWVWPPHCHKWLHFP